MSSSSEEDGRSSTPSAKSWPAPQDQIEAARQFLKETAQQKRFTVIVPDKDADGLSGALIVQITLETLGVPDDKMHIHFLQKGQSVHTEVERKRLEEQISNRAEGQASLIIVDQGSRPGPSIIAPSLQPSESNSSKDKIRTKTLIIDHHQSTEWPEGSLPLTACQSPPISTSSLLTYLTCVHLVPAAKERIDWLALVGVFGDLGSNEIRFGESKGGWPVTKQMSHLGVALKREGRKTISDAVSLLNAPRRTAEFNVEDAWKALVAAKAPSDVLGNEALEDCRYRINQEIERCTHTPPKFSKDGRVALLRINSPCQVHPVIATRWSGTLKGAKSLVCVMCANPGHNPDPNLISFSCRLSSNARKLPEQERPSLRDLLKGYAQKASPEFLARVGSDFATGHNEATGGIIPLELFDELTQAMEIGVPNPNSPAEVKKRKEAEKSKGQTSIGSFFTKKTESEASSSPAKKQKTS